MGVEFKGPVFEINLVRIGVEFLGMFNNGVDSILFFSDKGPCMLIYLLTKVEIYILNLVYSNLTYIFIVFLFKLMLRIYSNYFLKKESI